jgi:hypothetical protein
MLVIQLFLSLLLLFNGLFYYVVNQEEIHFFNKECRMSLFFISNLVSLILFHFIQKRNQVLNMSIVFETVLAIILSYTPYLNQGLMMYPLK